MNGVFLARREEFGMNDQHHDNQNKSGGLGILFGAFVALAAIFFIVTGGSLGGKKTIESDKDLPPVATGAAPSSAPSSATTTGQAVR
jgi:hypothetical protein